MTNLIEQLRALADALEPMAGAPRFEDCDVPGFCAWVRACADAQPVAWMHIDGRVISAATMDQAYRDGGAMQSSLRDYTIPLYTHPAPAAPQAEPTRKPNPDEVICPACTHQFRAIPENVQAHLAEAIRERDDHARWRADLADKLHDRETTISAAWEALRSAGVHSEAAIDDGIRLLRRQIAEAQKEIHNLNWALGTEGYDQMATPEEQAEHEAAVRAHHDVLERLEEGKRAYEAMKLDARRYRWIAGHCRSTSEHWGGRWSIVVEGPCPAKHDEEDAFDAAIDAAMGLTQPAERS